jgi:CheY-like chemotaxis protein
MNGSCRILVVDDHRGVRHVAQVLFRSAGHEVETAGCCEEALEVAQSFRPNILLSDICLPGPRDGCELARILREELDGLDLYFCAMTGSPDPHEHSRAINSGFDEVRVKPLDYGEWLDALAQRFLNRSIRS